MKFASNHPDEFNLPKIAWTIGFLQFVGGICTELISIAFMSSSSLAKPIDVIIKFIALASIASIDNFYGNALPGENKVKKNFAKGKPIFTNHRRMFLQPGFDTRSCGVKFLSIVTKMLRIVYSSWLFYFMPFMILVLPYLIND
jgi:hypothetical protein